MNKSIVALTSGLAISTIYLWSELREARSQVVLLNRVSAEAPMPRANATATPPAPAPAATECPPEDSEKTRQKMLDEGFRDSLRRTLAQLSDPAMRAQMFEEWKEANSPNKARYARYLGISEVDAGRIIDVLADQHFAQAEAYARCNLQPPCDASALFSEADADREVALTDLLGAEKKQRFEHYTYTGVERSLVSQFLREKIPLGSQLSEDQAEKLIDALADERRIVETALRQQGSEPFLYPMEGVPFTFQSNFSERGKTGERLQEAAEYNRRIHARAKAILTPQQLAAFEQMQEAGIAGVKYWLRQQERDLATRAADSGEGR